MELPPGAEAQVYAVTRVVARALLDDELALIATLGGMQRELAAVVREAGCTHAGPIRSCVAASSLSLWTDDDRSRWRRVLDALLRRPAPTPPPPAFMLRMEVRAA